MLVEKVSSFDVRDQWTTIVDKINRTQGICVVERYRKPVAAVIDIELLELLEEKLGVKLEYATTEAEVEAN